MGEGAKQVQGRKWRKILRWEGRKRGGEQG